MPNPAALAAVGDTAAELAKEMLLTEREVEITITNETDGLTLVAGERFGGDNTECLSSVVDIGPNQFEGIVYSRPKLALSDCWGYQSFSLSSNHDLLLVVWYQVAGWGKNAFLVTSASSNLKFSPKQNWKFFHKSKYASSGTMSTTIAAYTVSANMSDGAKARMKVKIEDS